MIATTRLNKRRSEHSLTFPEGNTQDSLLSGVAESARRLLVIADFDTAVNGALGSIATAAAIDRIFIYQHCEAAQSGREFATCPYEWTQPGVIRTCEIPGQYPMFYDEFDGYTQWVAELKSGQSVQKLAREMSAAGQIKQKQEQALSVLTVPIFIEGTYWGNFGFDDCTTERIWSDAEISVLETAAASFAGALQRRGHQADLEAYNQQLRQRDDLLNSVNAAAQCLVANDDLAQAIPEALRILGEGARQDRVYVFENVYLGKPSEVFWEIPYEWNAPGINASSAVEDELPLPASAFPPRLITPLLEGKPCQFLTRDLDGVSLDVNEKTSTKAMIGVPIFVANQWWGVLAFDDCTTERVWTEAEIAVLETAAACVGSAIERDRTRQDREAAAQARAAELEAHNQALEGRDRILQAMAAASNVLLTEDDFDLAVNTALRILGESVGCDRVGVGQQHDDPTGETLGFVRFLYEWDSLGTSAQLTDHEGLADFPWQALGMAAWFAANIKGEAFGRVIDDLPEPFRGLQQQVNVQSTHNIPIFVEGRFWGVFGIDHCREKKLLSEAELAAFKTAANCFGSAIERNRAIKARAAELEQHNQTLAERDRILEATAAAANVMLTADDFDSAVNTALKIVGEGSGVDRVILGEYFAATDRQSPGYHQFLYEWTSPGTTSQIKHPELARVSDSGIEFAIDTVRRGEIFGGVVEELSEPFRSGQLELGVKSTYSVPIKVENCYWGVVGFDDCQKLTRRSESELEALKTLANCIGNAIERDSTVKAREAAEREMIVARERAARAAELEAANQVLTRRDRWLETTAIAAHQLLSSDDVRAGVRVALQTIGENLECDRVSVMQHILAPDAPAADLGLMRVLYEWDAEGIRSQCEDPDLREIPSDGVEDWFKRVMAGHWVGGLIGVLKDPFRSSMQALDIQSTYAMPVFVEGKFWGIVTMDHCRDARRLSAAELAVFKTAATCVGSAIYQASVRRDRAAQERARLLGSVAEAANLLLRTADYMTVFPEVTRLLGEAAGCDRCAITQDVIHKPSGSLAVKVLHEWSRKGVESAMGAAPDFFEEGLLLLEGHFLEFHKTLLRGEVVNFFVNDLTTPEKDFLEAQGNTSMLLVPIMVQGQCWGEIGFDNCGEPRLYDEAEIAILQIAAQSIAAVISRQAQEASVREAEERYRNLIELSTEGIYRLELDRPIPRSLPVREQVDLFYKQCYGAEANDAFAAMYGYKTAEEMIGWRLTDIHVEASERNIEFLSEWLASHDCRISNSESEELDVSGNVHYFLNNVIGIVEDNHLVRIWGTQTDITELKQAQQAREAAEKAVLAERERAAQERVTELAKTNEAISETLSALTATPELNEFLGQILIKISEQIGACKAHLFFYDEATDTLYQYIAVQEGQVYQGAAPGNPEMFHHPFPTNLSGAWQTIVNSPKPFTLDDNNPQAADLYWPESLPWHQAEGHRASTCACMRVGQKPIGFIGFAFRHIAVLTDEQLEFIQALTNQATLSIHLTRLAEEAKQTAISQEQEKAAQQRAVQLTRSNQALKRSLDSLAQQPELGAFLQRVVNEATAQTGAANGHLFLHDTVTHTIALRVATENGGNWRDVTDMALWQQPVPVDFAPALWEAMLEKKPFFEEDFQSTLKPGPHIWEPSITWHRQRGHTRIICAPLVLGEQVLGFLGLSFVGETIFTPDEVELTQALANQATLAIQLTRLAEEAKQVAISQEQEKAAQERAAELAKTNEAIAKTLTTLAASPELDKFLGTILVEMARQLNACKAHLFLYDQATHTLTQRLAIQDGQFHLGVGPNDPEMFAHPVPADMTPGWNAIITSERPLTYDETLPFDESIWWPESLAWHKAQGHKAITCIPMKAGETPIGYIGFCFYDRTVLSDEQLEFMQALANQAIVAIQLTTLAEEAKQAAVLQAQEKAAQQRVAELAKTNEALSQTLNVLTTEPELDRFLGKILTQINEQIGADDAHLFLYDPETHALRQQVAVQSGQVFPFNAPGDPDIFRQPVPADITQAWQIALNSPKPFVIDQNDPESAAFLWPGTAEWHQSRGHCTTVCACMKVGNQPLGFIGFAFRDCIVLTDEQLEFIQALTNQATLSVHLARLAEQTQSAALTSERNRLAREIHDTLAQAFTGVSLQLEAAKGVLNRNPDEAQTYMTRAGKLARRGLSEARRSVRALRSQALETDTLPKALQTAIQEMTQDSPMQGEFNLIGTPLPLPEDLQTNLLRIGQEAITNALRHAQAQHLILTLQFTREQVRIYITDNGKGCQINAITEVEGFGLLGMRERTLRFGGQFSFKSALGEGTIIDIMIPIEGIG